MKSVRKLSVFLIMFLSINHAHAEILVSAAASLKDAFTKISLAFQKQEGISVALNFAGSGKLRAQIENGAPVDIFASASSHHMNILEEKKLIQKNSKRYFANNSLVLVQSNKSKNKITTIAELGKEKIKNVVIGNPKTVPAGRYAQEALIHFKVYERIIGKLVFGENVRQVRDYVEKNEVDAGLIFSTDLVTSKNITKVLELSKDSHSKIVYPVAIIKSSQNIVSSQKFITYLTGKKGQEILKQYGFK